MNRYRVTGGVLRIGPGTLLHLSGAQIRARAHNLDLPKDYQLVARDPREKPPVPVAAVVKGRTVLEFKTGEELGIEGDLPRNILGQLAPLDRPEAPAQSTLTPVGAGGAKGKR